MNTVNWPVRSFDTGEVAVALALVIHTPLTTLRVPGRPQVYVVPLPVHVVPLTQARALDLAQSG